MSPRPSTLFAALLALGLGLALWLTAVQPRFAADRAAARENATRELVAGLGLTDLALFTEARYTRNPTHADLFSAFQDQPGGLDLFPAGSMVPPPFSLRSPRAVD